MDKVMEMENKKADHELKHLGFVRVAAIQAVVCVCNLYDYAKNNAGALRSTVGSVENAVTSIVGPVYQKFKGVPDHLLVFLDHKVDEAAHEFDKHAPPLVRHVAFKAHSLIHKTLEKAQRLLKEAETGGPRAAIHYATAESKELILSQGVYVWIKLNKIPPLHMVADMTVPTAAHWSKKYNHTVEEMRKKGYAGFCYLPLVPIDEITKAYKQGQAEKNGEINIEKKYDSGSDSD